MKIHTYTIVRNDAFMIRYFLAHYSLFSEKIYVIDEYSEDGTTEIAKAHKKVTHLQIKTGGIDDNLFNKIWEDFPKTMSQDADYVITVDCDEFIYGDMNSLKGDLIVPEGWQMISEKLPTGQGQIYDEIKEGIPDIMHNKPVIRKPHVTLKYAHGRHSCNVLDEKCDVVNDPRIRLLHFRFIDREYVRKRHERNWSRIVQSCKNVGSGIHNKPNWEGYQGMNWYENALKEKKPLPCLILE